ncbi:C16orf58 [Branchiostoma lanceolatum]|uniref:C16orf58 protein n=1 Tax=Branchiostoma lanceolatum TaxID=7740 RepID=A0A8K0EEQ4_BRALA|nr:C16orf58 [Branchiostoma lanceolatum]
MQAPLHYRALQTLLNQALEREGSFDSITSLSPPAKDDLQWWVNHVRGVNGRRVFVPTDLTIFSDASLQGWGACCNGQRTGGRWSQLEAGNHINWLELQAAFLALKSFASKQDHHVLLKLDNTTAVAYINRMGGTKSPTLAALALEIWHWALQKGLMLSASHLPGLDNTEADSCSRVFQDKTEWQLDRSVFLQINAQTDFALTIDLFASRLNAQLPRFVAWRPDPMAVAVNALDMDWYQLGLAYAFPPFSLVFRVLRKVQTDHATVMLVAPVWRAQAWYPKLLHMLYDRPTLLPHRRDLLFLPHNKEHHPLFPRLKLAVWPVSGDSCKVEAFLQELQSSSCQPGERVPLDSINHLGDDGVAGVIAGVSIPFQGLPVGSTTIARWIKTVLELAGVDVSTYSAHSTRGASTSAAAAAGVSLTNILKAADWSRESTFQKFYRRETDMDHINIVLHQESSHLDFIKSCFQAEIIDYVIEHRFSKLQVHSSIPCYDNQAHSLISSDKAFQSMVEQANHKALWELVDSSHEVSAQVFPSFHAGLAHAGWTTHRTQLGPDEWRASWDIHGLSDKKSY